MTDDSRFLIYNVSECMGGPIMEYRIRSFSENLRADVDISNKVAP